MNDKRLKIFNIKFLSEIKYFVISATVFILYSLDRYLPRGWDYYSDNWGIDQALIENIAGKFIKGESLVGHLSHGIGYPLVISPFLYITANPLNIAGFFIFTLTASVILKNIDQVITSRKIKLFFIFAIIISFAVSPDMKFWVIGASNQLSAALILLSVLWSISPKVPKSLPIILGLLSGLVFSSRYVDYLLLSPLYFSALLNYSKIYKKNLLNNLIYSFLISLIFIIPTFLMHKFVLGDWFTTPYHGKPSDVVRLAGFDKSEASLSSKFYNWIIPNLYSTIIDYKSFSSNLAAKGEPTALLISPILYLAPYSIINFLFSCFNKNDSYFRRQLNISILCIAFSFFIWTIYYASGWAYTTHDLLFGCLRYFMGWFSLIIFLSLYGLIIKPKFNTLLLATFLYFSIANYPSIYLKNEFKDVNIVDKVLVYRTGSEDFKKEFKLPIPFDLGKKSLLAIFDNNTIIGVDNYSNQIFLGECDQTRLNIKSFQNDSQNCKYFISSQSYLAEDGMEFLNLEKNNSFYQISYKIFENDKPLIRNFKIKTKLLETLENAGSVILLEDHKNRFKIKDSRKKTFILKRNGKKYLNNSTNYFWPQWKINAAEKIDSKNQILTINEKNKIYCIWELDKNWNYNKDRLCASFSNRDLDQHEKEFGVDIDNDGFINKKFIGDRNSDNSNLYKSAKPIFKVNPIRFEENKILLNSKVEADKKTKTELNIKLIKTGDTINDTFPSSISLNCGEAYSSCKALRTGRLNNLWRIWIKNYKSYGSLELVTEGIKRNHPSFWPIQYLTLRNK